MVCSGGWGPEGPRLGDWDVFKDQCQSVSETKPEGGLGKMYAIPRLTKHSAKLTALSPVSAAFHPSSFSKSKKDDSTLLQSAERVTEVKSSENTVSGRNSRTTASCQTARLQRLNP